MTSLFMRDMSAPVCVRVKKESGWRWMWSNSAVRMSKMRPSPIFAEYHRCASCSTALSSARPTAASASAPTSVRSFSGMAVSSSARRISGGIAPTIDASTTVITNPTISVRSPEPA